MEWNELVTGRRTIRRFEQRPLPREVLCRILDGVRRASCAANLQRLRFVVVRRSETVKAIFDTTAWAGMVRPRRTPTWGVDAPLCFIAVTAPEEQRQAVLADAGAAIQTMEYAAWNEGIGCCWFASFDPEKVRETLGLAAGTAVLYVVALGYPAEAPVSEDVAAGGSVRYYLDDEDRLHVPKFTVDALTTWI